MKKMIIEKCMNIIKKHQNYDKVKLAEIEYGLTGLYLTVSKSIIISIICLILGIFKEMLIFTFIYGLLRTLSFGIHATKSWICLLFSINIFIGIPFLCTFIKLDFFIKLVIGIILILLMFKNSPADTKKRPIINSTRRLFYKISSSLLAILYVSISLITNNIFISNCLIFSLIIQNILIAPLTYKIAKQPYNNYKNYVTLQTSTLN